MKTTEIYQTWGQYGSIKLELSIDLSGTIELDRDISYEIRRKLQESANLLIEKAIKEDKELKRQGLVEMLHLLELFPKTIHVKKIPNEYYSGEYGKHFPWFNVTTPIGVIKIGWRKRVIVIDWENSDILESAEELFPNEDVTKYDKLIHAHGYEKAQEYINKLLQI